MKKRNKHSHPASSNGFSEFHATDEENASAASQRPRKANLIRRLIGRIPPNARHWLLAFLLVPLGVFGLGHVVCDQMLRFEPDTSRSQERDARPGDITTLYDRSGGNIAVVPLKSDFDRLTELSVAKDYEGIEQMILTGRVLPIPSETKIRIIRRKIAGYEVRLLGGIFEGRSAWVTDNQVAKVWP